MPTGSSKTAAVWQAVAAALIALVSAASPARAERVVHPWELLGDGIVGSYAWPSTLWHVSAVAVTPPIVFTLDSPVQREFQKPNDFRQSFAEAMLVGGSFTPVLIPLGLYLGGLAGDASEIATAGSAALQAAAVQAVLVTALKWLTDRAGPYPDGDPSRRRELSGLFRDSDDPKDWDFNPFDIHGGLRWPSGHTASHFAIVSALVAFYPKHPWIAAVGYPLALLVAIGMIDGDYHWLSDVVAGALIGHAIGWTIGKNFRRRYDALNQPGLRRGDAEPARGGAQLQFSF